MSPQNRMVAGAWGMLIVLAVVFIAVVQELGNG